VQRVQNRHQGKEETLSIGNLIKHFPKVTEEDLNQFGANELKEFCQANEINTKGNQFAINVVLWYVVRFEYLE
jgi:hypothetical protein